MTGMQSETRVLRPTMVELCDMSGDVTAMVDINSSDLHASGMARALCMYVYTRQAGETVQSAETRWPHHSCTATKVSGYLTGARTKGCSV